MGYHINVIMLFIMSPHPEHFYNLCRIDDLVYKSVLYVYAARIGT